MSTYVPAIATGESGSAARIVLVDLALLLLTALLSVTLAKRVRQPAVMGEVVTVVTVAGPWSLVRSAVGALLFVLALVCAARPALRWLPAPERRWTGSGLTVHVVLCSGLLTWLQRGGRRTGRPASGRRSTLGRVWSDDGD